MRSRAALGMVKAVLDTGIASRVPRLVPVTLVGRERAVGSPNVTETHSAMVEVSITNRLPPNMSLVLRKPVFGVSDQVPHKGGCTATEDG